MATRQGAAVDKWPAAAKLWTVATAGHLPTAVIHHDWGHGPQKKLFFNLRRLKGKIGAIGEGDLKTGDATKISCILGVPEQERDSHEFSSGGS